LLCQFSKPYRALGVAELNRGLQAQHLARRLAVVARELDCTGSDVARFGGAALRRSHPGSLPYSATLSPDGKRLYVTNFAGSVVTIIDTDPSSANYQTVISNVPVSINPYFSAISADGDRLYVTNATGGVSIINTDTSNVIATTTTVSGARVIAISPTDLRPYVVAGNTFYALESDRFDTVGAVIQTSTITGASNAWGLDITPDGSRAYVAGFNSNTVSVIDTDAGHGTYLTTLASITVTGKPTTVAVSPDGTRVYVDTNTGGVVIIDSDPSSATYNTVLKTINVPTGEGDIVISPDGTHAYVTNLSGGSVTVLPLPLI
jgi:YVTN family beta-propeller protein